jgi:hypothetical protein
MVLCLETRGFNQATKRQEEIRALCPAGPSDTDRVTGGSEAGWLLGGGEEPFTCSVEKIISRPAITRRLKSNT